MQPNSDHPWLDASIWYGGDVKALDDSGRFGGHLVLWGSAEEPDLSDKRDFFTPETDLGRYVKGTMGVLYYHGLPRIGRDPNPLADMEIGEAEFKNDDAGLWMQGQLRLRDQYEYNVWEMVKAGKLGLSSGPIAHLVRRRKQPNGTYKMVRWPIAEASLTPTPAEPRTAAVALKSLMIQCDGEDPSAPFLEACLKTVADLSQAASRFAKLSPSKRDAIKSLRDALDGVYAAGEPRPDPADDQRLYHQFLAHDARLAGVTL